MTEMEMEREIRALRRKLTLAETNLARARQTTAAQSRVESILNDSLKKDLRFFKLVLENTNSILMLLDIDGRFAYASDAFLSAAGVANIGLINGMHYREVLSGIVTPTVLARLVTAVGRAVSDKDAVSIEMQIDFRFTGEPRTFSVF